MSESPRPPPIILVIDDNETYVKVMIRLLTAEGYIVHGAFTAIDGLKQIAQHSPDVILLDNHLPDIRGMELLRYYLRPVKAKVIVVTGGTIEEFPSSTPVLTKPIALNELIEEIEKGLPPKPDPRKG